MNAAELRRDAEPRVDEEAQVEGHVEPDCAAGDHRRRRPPVARFLTALIHAYQAARSGRPTGCRYLPSCSEYAVQAIDNHGAGRGSVLAVRRILRCGPWGGHGVDPVPERSAS